jgi:CBS-domain-containing membrane protein
MSHRVVRVDAARPALEAAHLLLRRRLGALPVLEPRGPLQGILSVVDFLQWLVGRT